MKLVIAEKPSVAQSIAKVIFFFASFFFVNSCGKPGNP